MKNKLVDNSNNYHNNNKVDNPNKTFIKYVKSLTKT